VEHKIYNLTAQQLRHAADIKDEIAKLTKALMELAGESQRNCAAVKDITAKIPISVNREPLIAVSKAPERSNTTGELPPPTPVPIFNDVAKITDQQHPSPTTHVTDGLHPTSNSQLTDEQHQTPVVYVTEGQQETTTGIATSTETASNQEHLVSSVPPAVPVKWEIQRLLQEVARVIAEHPEKIPALRSAGIPAITNDYLREATEVVAKLNFTAEERYASLWELGKNVTQDVAVLPAINELGMRNLGDLLGKLNELGDYASRRGQILILARLWSLVVVATEPLNTEEALA
jgi:hypothetical protein